MARSLHRGRPQRYVLVLAPGRLLPGHSAHSIILPTLCCPIGYIAKGFRNLMLVPISFVNEHIETLHELDIEYCKELVEKVSVCVCVCQSGCDTLCVAQLVPRRLTRRFFFFFFFFHPPGAHCLLGHSITLLNYSQIIIYTLQALTTHTQIVAIHRRKFNLPLI